MFTEKEILTRLQNGENVQKIADEMTKMLNAASATYDQEKKEKDAIKAVKKNKMNDMKALLEQMFTYLKTYYPVYNEITDGIFDEMDAEELVDYVDETFEGFDELGSLFGSLGRALLDDMPKSNVKKTHGNEKLNKDLGQMRKRTTDADKVLHDFLKNSNW